MGPIPFPLHTLGYPAQLTVRLVRGTQAWQIVAAQVEPLRTSTPLRISRLYVWILTARSSEAGIGQCRQTHYNGF